MEQADRKRRAVAPLQIQVQHLGAQFAGHRRRLRQQHGGIAGHDIAQAQRAVHRLGQIEAEPPRQRRVHILDLAALVGGEEARRRVIKIVDGVLQLLEDIFLALALQRHVSDAPDRARLGLRRTVLAQIERLHRNPVPARLRLIALRADAKFLVPLAPLARRLGKAEHRIIGFRMGGKGARHRAGNRPPLAAAHQAVGLVGEQNALVGPGYHHAFGQRTQDFRRNHTGRRALADAHHSGCQREQGHHPDYRKQRQQAQNIGFCGLAPDHRQRDRRPHQRQRQHHQPDQAARLLAALPASLRQLP